MSGKVYIIYIYACKILSLFRNLSCIIKCENLFPQIKIFFIRRRSYPAVDAFVHADNLSYNQSRQIHSVGVLRHKTFRNVGSACAVPILLLFKTSYRYGYGRYAGRHTARTRIKTIQRACRRRICMLYGNYQRLSRRRKAAGRALQRRRAEQTAGKNNIFFYFYKRTAVYRRHGCHGYVRRVVYGIYTYWSAFYILAVKRIYPVSYTHQKLTTNYRL